MSELSPYQLGEEERRILERGPAASIEDLAGILAGVSELHAGAVGFAGRETDTHRTYRMLLERGPAASAAFQRILETGTPAAQLYAALGLRCLKQTAAANSGLDRLSQESAEVVYFSGCARQRLKVGDLARQLLQDPEAWRFLCQT